MKTGTFDQENLELVSRAPPPDDPPLAVDDRCRLTSGGPTMIVTGAEGDFVRTKWQYGESHLPRGAVRRVAN